MANVSLIDDMPNITGNFSDEVYAHQESLYERIFLEVFTFVGLLSVIANSFLGFVILKYKRMRDDPTNKIFLHINILQAIFLLATPFTARLGMDLYDVTPVHVIVFCITYQIEFNVLFGVVWFLFLLVCDWYIKQYHKNTYNRFTRVYKFFIILIYVIIVLSCSTTIQLCFENYMVLITYLIMMGCAGLLVLFLFIINIVHVIKKRRLIDHTRGNIGLAICNICFLCWFPVILGFLLALNMPVAIIAFFAIAHASPVFNIIYLYNCDDNYHIFLKNVFKCRCSKYSNESLDNRVSYSDGKGVQIPEHLS